VKLSSKNLNQLFVSATWHKLEAGPRLSKKTLLTPKWLGLNDFDQFMAFYKHDQIEALEKVPLKQFRKTQFEFGHPVVRSFMLTLIHITSFYVFLNPLLFSYLINCPCIWEGKKVENHIK